VNITYLNDDVIEIILDLQKDISYISWQFLTFALKDNLWDFYRSYSIANKQWTHYTFLIKLKENGKAWILLKTFKVWDSIHYTNISWNFHLQKTQNPKVFIATWTGLAPIYSLLWNTQTDISKKLYFWVTRKKDLFYVDKIKEIKNLEVTICVSQEEVEFFHFWRIDISNEVFEKNTEFYICWNPWLIDSIKKSLYEKWYTQVYCEEF
jgi:NAD(P)H-flavin reductase